MTYHLTNEVKRASQKLAENIDTLAHIDVKRILFAIAKTRAGGDYGTFASCQPLRFEGGEEFLTFNQSRYQWPEIVVGGRAMLYAITTYVPRFLDISHQQKVETLVHELYHISPYFNGDIRRLGRGRHAHHGPSRAFYDKLIAPHVKEAMQLLDPDDFPFLRHSAEGLRKAVGGIVGARFKGLRPRLVAGNGEPDFSLERAGSLLRSPDEEECA